MMKLRKSTVKFNQCTVNKSIFLMLLRVYRWLSFHCRMIKLLIKEQFKDGFDAVFEHLANKGQGGHVSIGWWDACG